MFIFYILFLIYAPQFFKAVILNLFQHLISETLKQVQDDVSLNKVIASIFNNIQP
jgi:hypothetical protein